MNEFLFATFFFLFLKYLHGSLDSVSASVVFILLKYFLQNKIFNNDAGVRFTKQQFFGLWGRCVNMQVRFAIRNRFNSVGATWRLLVVKVWLCGKRNEITIDVASVGEMLHCENYQLPEDHVETTLDTVKVEKRGLCSSSSGMTVILQLYFNLTLSHECNVKNVLKWKIFFFLTEICNGLIL